MTVDEKLWSEFKDKVELNKTQSFADAVERLSSAAAELEQ